MYDFGWGHVFLWGMGMGGVGGMGGRGLYCSLQLVAAVPYFGQFRPSTSEILRLIRLNAISISILIFFFNMFTPRSHVRRYYLVKDITIICQTHAFNHFPFIIIIFLGIHIKRPLPSLEFDKQSGRLLNGAIRTCTTIGKNTRD